VWANMVSGLSDVVGADVTKTDEKLAPKFLAAKDLAELLKAGSISYNVSYYQTYVEASYMMEDAVLEAETKGLLDKGMLDAYNKDVSMEYRTYRLKAESRLY
jgi:hypothetical protein